jgi:hypothetical protein
MSSAHLESIIVAALLLETVHSSANRPGLPGSSNPHDISLGTPSPQMAPPSLDPRLPRYSRVLALSVSPSRSEHEMGILRGVGLFGLPALALPRRLKGATSSRLSDLRPLPLPRDNAPPSAYRTQPHMPDDRRLPDLLEQ